MHKDWFAPFARAQISDRSKARATRATRATPAATPQEYWGSGISGTVALVAHAPLKRATIAEAPQSAEHGDVPAPVAPVAHVAHENDKPADAGDTEGWRPEDWRTFYEERAAIAENDGGQSRAEAEETAYECCVIEWMNRNPAPSEPGNCAWCGEDEGPESTIVAFGTEDAGHAWLHSHCWSDWYEHRREEAIHVLAAMGTTFTY